MLLMGAILLVHHNVIRIWPFLVLKLGGPSLLDILYRARVLPSVSTAYKMVKQNKPIMSAIDIPPKVFFDNNIVIPEDNTKALSLKMDETYVKPNLSYSPCDNKVYSICYQHGSHHNLELDTFDDCLELQSKVQKGILHVPKECTVVGIAGLDSVNKFEPVLIWL